MYCTCALSWNQHGTWTVCTAWLTRSAKDRRVSTKDPRVSMKDCQVPWDLYLMFWRSQLCLISRGRGVFTVTRCLMLNVRPMVKIKWTKKHHCFRANERISWRVSWGNRGREIEAVFGYIGACNFIANKLIWGKVIFFLQDYIEASIMIIDKNISSKHQHTQSCTTFVMTVLYSAVFSGFLIYVVLQIMRE